MAVTTYRAANFQDNLTLNMPGGTGTGTSTWTLNQSTANLPSGTFRFLVYTDVSTFVTTREIGEAVVTGANTISVTARGSESTTAIDHPNGSIFAIVNTAGMENAQNEAIADLYTTGGTAIVTAGEAYAATTFVTDTGVNQAFSLPTLLYESAGKWYKTVSSASGTGARIRIAMAYEASSGDGASVRIYLPGSSITVGTTTSTYLSRNFSNSATAGACESTVRPTYHTLVGYYANLTTFKFIGPIYNNVAWHQITVPVVSGGVFASGDVILPSAVTGKWVVASNTYGSSSQTEVLIAAGASSGADQIVQAYMPGSMVPMTVSNGVPYYLGASGATSTTLSGTFLVNLGVGYDNLLHFNPVILNRNSNFQESILAGENWTAGDILYQKASNGYFYRADTDVAESGICEKVAIASATHTGGSGSRQMAYYPGAIIRNLFTISTYTRMYPSATPGSYSTSTPPSYDTFYRAVAYASEANVVRLEPQEMQFLPTGIQEKGYLGLGSFVTNTVSQAGQTVYVGTNFKKIMVNTPSSITLTVTATSALTAGPTAQDITRFGFMTSASKTTGGSAYYWDGTYQTVGN